MNTMKRILCWITVLVMLLSLVGCAPEATEQTQAPDTSITGTEDTGTPDGNEETPDAEQPEEDATDPENEPQQGQAQKPEKEENPQPEQKPDPQPEQQPEQKPEPEPAPPAAQKKGFEVHFIDVGQADAALVICDGKAMLIDGGNVADSSRMYTYLKNHNITHLDYVIGSHAHEDHIGGIAGALNYASVGVAYCPVTSYSSNAFNNFVKAVQKHGASITVPTAGTTFSLGSATCRILAVNTASDANNTSIVMKITYGSTSFLFTGDAEREVEQALLNGGQNLSATVLKVGHHGSSTSTSYLWLRQIMPKYAVISVGSGNSYGHPTEDVLSRLRDAEVKTFRTDMQGDVVCTSNGSTVSFTVSRNANADVFGGIGGNSTQKPPEQETPAGTQYVLNNSSMKFHYESCEYAQKISDRNREDYQGDRQTLIEMGYSSCGVCHP